MHLRSTLLITKLIALVLEVKAEPKETSISLHALWHTLGRQKEGLFAAVAFTVAMRNFDSAAATDDTVAAAAAEAEEAKMLRVLLARLLMHLMQVTIGGHDQEQTFPMLFGGLLVHLMPAEQSSFTHATSREIRQSGDRLKPLLVFYS